MYTYPVKTEKFLLVNAKNYLHLDIIQSGKGDKKLYVNLPDVEKLGGLHQRLVIFIFFLFKKNSHFL